LILIYSEWSALEDDFRTLLSLPEGLETQLATQV
jgi:hypothetical protein